MKTELATGIGIMCVFLGMGGCASLCNTNWSPECKACKQHDYQQLTNRVERLERQMRWLSENVSDGALRYPACTEEWKEISK